MRKAVSHSVQTACPVTAAKELTRRITQSLSLEPDLVIFFGAGPEWKFSNIGEQIKNEFSDSCVVFGGIGSCSSNFGVIDGAYEVQDHSPVLGGLAISFDEGSTRLGVFGTSDESSVNDRFSMLRFQGDNLSGSDQWKQLASRSRADAPDLILVTNKLTEASPMITKSNVLLPHSVKLGGVCTEDTSLFVSGLGQLNGPLSSIGLLLDGPSQARARITPFVSQGLSPFGREMVVTGLTRNHDGSYMVTSLDGSPICDIVRKPLGDFKKRSKDGVLYLGVALENSNDFLGRPIVAADPGLLLPTGFLMVEDVFVEVGTRVCFHLLSEEDSRRNFCDNLVDFRANLPPNAAALMFSDLKRGESLYGEGDVESALVQSVCGEVPLVGFFGLQQLGPLGQGKHQSYVQSLVTEIGFIS